MPFTIETAYTWEEYWRYNLAASVMRGERKKLVIAFAVLLALILLTVWLEDYSLTGFLALFTVLYPVVLWFACRGRARRAWGSNTVLQNAVIHYTFTEGGVEITGANGEQHLDYGQIYRLVETKTNIYLMIADNQGYIIRRDACTEEQRAAIRAHCGA